MRLIDADALLERMRKDPLFHLVELYGQSGVIKAEPTVEAIPKTNRAVLTSVIETCNKYHTDCETCPYWLKNRLGCIWLAGKDVVAYWEDEIEERSVE